MQLMKFFAFVGWDELSCWSPIWLRKDWGRVRRTISRNQGHWSAIRRFEYGQSGHNELLNTTMKLPKETVSTNSPHGRWYDDACGTAFGMELLGERWSLLIVRELMFGPRRFSDIRANLPGISAKTLTERLAGLENNGIVTRITAPEPTPAQLYGLTNWGYGVEPIIQELGRWAAASPLHNPTLPLSPASFMLSLRTMLDRDAARGVSVLAVFAIGTARFTVRLADGEISVERGESMTKDLRFEAPSATSLAAVFYGGLAPKEAGVRVDSNPIQMRHFADLFSLPSPSKA